MLTNLYSDITMSDLLEFLQETNTFLQEWAFDKLCLLCKGEEGQMFDLWVTGLDNEAQMMTYTWGYNIGI